MKMESNNNDSLRLIYLFVVTLMLATSALLDPLISPRPDDLENTPKRTNGMNTHKVESRLWQDPIATIERYYYQFIAPDKSLINNDFSLNKLIANFKNQHGYEKIDEINIIAVSLLGDAYAEALEIHRRNRFAVISALAEADYYPKESEMLMFFRYQLESSKKKSPKREINVPYEWFGKENKAALVLWLNEHQITSEQYIEFTQSLFENIYTEFSNKNINFNLVGPSSTPLLLEILKEKPISLGKHFKDHKNVRFISPNATISNSDIARRIDDIGETGDYSNRIKDSFQQRSVIRSSGTDDILAKALIQELQQRGISKPNSIFGDLKKIACEKVELFACHDRLVLIHELDSVYSRDLSEHLKKEFNTATQRKEQDSVTMFTYFRGLDGKMSDIKEDGVKVQKKNEKTEISTLIEQMDDAPPEHAEGRNQYDYLRRLSDVIAQLDAKSETHRVKAIGIIGNDVYDKLIILKALHERFKDKVFFTTDLDARYLHADQNKWARNLVVASSYDLTLHEKLQSSTMPFRASYQTATFFATLLALKNDEDVSEINEKLDKWLKPQIFEIGKTEAIHLASHSVNCLSTVASDNAVDCTNKPQESLSENPANLVKNGFTDLFNHDSIEPSRIPFISFEKNITFILLAVIIGVLLYCHRTRLRDINQQKSTHVNIPHEIPFGIWVICVISVLLIGYLIVKDNFPTHHDGEPLVWTEGISVWPNLLIRFFGIVGIAMLSILTYFKMYQRIEEIEDHLKGAFSTENDPAKTKIGNFDNLWKKYKENVTNLKANVLSFIIFPALIGLLISGFIFILYPLNFPYRGSITANLHGILRFFQFFMIWLLIFWTYYEINSCLWLVKKLNKIDAPIFSPTFLSHKEQELGIPSMYLDNYLKFRLIVDISERINSLIYLPFLMILTVIIGRSTYFDALGLAPSLIAVFVFEVLLLWWIVYRLHQSASSFRNKILNGYELIIKKEAWCNHLFKKENNSLNILIEDIRNTRQGAYASYINHPLLSAVLLPIGGISGLHIIENLFG